MEINRISFILKKIMRFPGNLGPVNRVLLVN